jgi:hypothetical protein
MEAQGRTVLKIFCGLLLVNLSRRASWGAAVLRPYKIELAVFD